VQAGIGHQLGALVASEHRMLDAAIADKLPVIGDET
jgi:hypothetical protein